MTTIVAVCCVRMSSQRLPGKPLISYHPSGKSNIECIAERVATSRYNPNFIVATSTDKSDDPIEKWAKGKSIPLHRGSMDNVVKRMDEAINKYCPSANLVWRVMADCPLVDVGLFDWRADVLIRNNADVITILQPEPTYAGQASVWSREAWDHCAKISSGSLLQHPGEAIYESFGQFRTLHEIGPETIYYQNIRTELDTPQDLEFFRKVWSEYPPAQPWEDVNIKARSIMYSEGDKSYSAKGVLSWLATRPDIVAINADVKEKAKSTHLHGHHRARRFVWQECHRPLAHKVNDALDIQCPKCGVTRKFYI